MVGAMCGIGVRSALKKGYRYGTGWEPHGGNRCGSWVFSGLSAEEPNHHHSSRSAPLGELCISLHEREIVPELGTPISCSQMGTHE